jgi:PKD repeat protein
MAGSSTTTSTRASIWSTTALLGGKFTVIGGHLYAEEGSYPIHVTIHHDTAADVTVVSTADVADIPVVAIGGFGFSSVEGVASASQPLATFTDPAGIVPQSTYSADIDWGDNTSSTGEITLAGSLFTVGGSHTYAEEGSYSITVTIHHDTAPDVTATSTANVSDQVLQATGGFVFTGTEGLPSANQTVATFTDPAGAEALANYSALIAWGDGSTSAGAIGFDAVSRLFSVKGTHTYADQGGQAIQVTLHHEATSDVTVVSSAIIADAPVTFNGGTGVTATEGVALSGAIATFTDANPNPLPVDFIDAIIDWGDGTSDIGDKIGRVSIAGGTLTVSGTHTYAEDGTYTVSVFLQDIGGQRATGTLTIVVTEPPINVTPTSVSGFEFTALTNVPLATFTHPGNEAPGAYMTSISWGDGTTSIGLVTQSGMTYAVSASHTYSDEGNYSVRVTITEDSASITFQTTATILEELLRDGTRGTPNQRWLSEVYRDLLGRQIDPVGLVNNTNALVGGMSRQQIVSGIERSSEYFGKLANSVYFSLLGRPIDPVGLNMSLSILGGTSFLGNPSRVEMLKAVILSSPEYFAKHGSTNEGFLQGLYQDILGRPVEAGALSARSAQLGQGTSRVAEAFQVLTSPEAYAAVVQADYRADLHRDVDAGSLPGWVNALTRGLDDQGLVADLVASDEYFARTAP